jgi:hypothetical protein
MKVHAGQRGVQVTQGPIQQISESGIEKQVHPAIDVGLAMGFAISDVTPEINDG